MNVLKLGCWDQANTGCMKVMVCVRVYKIESRGREDRIN